MKRYLLSGRMLANVLVLGLLGVWFFTLAPTLVNGPAAYIKVSGHSMDGTYKTGDLVVTREQDTYGKGDIVAFEVPNGMGTGQVIHRIIGGNGRAGYTMQGDNNPDPDPVPAPERTPTSSARPGRTTRTPAWVFELPQNPTYVGLAAGLFTLIVLAFDARPRRRRDGEATVDEPRDSGAARGSLAMKHTNCWAHSAWPRHSFAGHVGDEPPGLCREAPGHRRTRSDLDGGSAVFPAAGGVRGRCFRSRQPSRRVGTTRPSQVARGIP